MLVAEHAKRRYCSISLAQDTNLYKVTAWLPCTYIVVSIV